MANEKIVSNTLLRHMGFVKASANILSSFDIVQNIGIFMQSNRGGCTFQREFIAGIWRARIKQTKCRLEIKQNSNQEILEKFSSQQGSRIPNLRSYKNWMYETYWRESPQSTRSDMCAVDAYRICREFCRRELSKTRKIILFAACFELIVVKIRLTSPKKYLTPTQQILLSLAIRVFRTLKLPSKSNSLKS